MNSFIIPLYVNESWHNVHRLLIKIVDVRTFVHLSRKLFAPSSCEVYNRRSLVWKYPLAAKFMPCLCFTVYSNRRLPGGMIPPLLRRGAVGMQRGVRRRVIKESSEVQRRRLRGLRTLTVESGSGCCLWITWVQICSVRTYQRFEP